MVEVKRYGLGIVRQSVIVEANSTIEAHQRAEKTDWNSEAGDRPRIEWIVGPEKTEADAIDRVLTRAGWRLK